MIDEELLEEIPFQSIATIGCFTMTDKTIDLDQHRGMAAQKATDLRRLLTEVAANQQALRVTQDQLEAQLIAAPATTWEDVADKVRYLLSVLGATPSGQDPRRQTLIKAVLDDFSRLSRDTER